MIDLKQLMQKLNVFLPLSGVKDYCPNGLQVEGKSVLKKIATGVSANLETIEKAIEKGVDALIVHHGIFWNGDSPIVTGVKKKKLQLLIENNISLIAYHLPLDMHQEVGNNWRAAQEMGWTNLKPFGLIDNTPIGVQGDITPIDREHFRELLENYYNHKATAALGGKKIITSVALISGGSYRSLKEAAKEGLDAFITGNFDEPAWSDAFEEKINFFAMGHSATEKIGPRSLAAYIQENWGLPAEFLDVNNPF